MSALDAHFVELLRPLVRELVREEVKRAKLELRWRPLKVAAQELGITDDALRQRIKAGSVPGKKVDGRIYVNLAEHDRRLDQLP